MAEGIPMAENYDYNPFKYDWYQSNIVKSLLKGHGHVVDKKIMPKTTKKTFKVILLFYKRKF